MFSVGELPETLEREPNSTIAEAQSVALPILIDGRIAKPGDADVYKFIGRAGEKLVIDVQARRLGSPLDSIVTLTDAKGKLIASNDDFDDKGAGLVTHQADSFISTTLPASGKYYVTVRDAQSEGGPEYSYRLKISEPLPSFDLRIVPSSVSGRALGTVPLTVYAIRRDGYAGEISLSLKDSPAGFALDNAIIPAGADKATVNLRLPAATGGVPVKLQWTGTATIEGKPVVKPGVPAEDMMQAFAYRHLVPCDEFLALVTGRYR